MKFSKVILIILLITNLSFSQEVYINVGRNFTSYDFKNSDGESNPNLDSSSGSAFEIGYIYTINDNIGISTAITLDQFNATGGNLVNNYSWDTSYLGLQGLATFSLISSYRSPIKINLLGGLNLNHIISGEQKINGQTFKLVSEDEFNGVFLRPKIGLEFQYFLLDDISIGMGYNYSKNFGIMNSSEQKLNFNNSQLNFKILMSLN